jgi:two-component system, LytTR family, sensor kinase
MNKDSVTRIRWIDTKRFTSDFAKINILFWSLIAIINYFQDVLLLYEEKKDNIWSFAAIFSLGWLIWAALTPLIVRLAIQFPMTWKGMYKSFLIHFGLCTSFVAIHNLLEFLSIEFMIGTVFPQHANDVYLPGHLASSIHSEYIIYFLIVGGTQRFKLYGAFQKNKEETYHLKEQLSAAQLMTLRMQLHPHFLFNTHHTISALILKNENDRAIQMLTRLSDLLRKSLEKTKSDFIPLQQELEMVLLYMEIQKVRFQERLKFILDVDPATNSVLVPSFFLQPLIENAVIHGIEPLAREGEIKLVINKTSENRLFISLEDNGVGMNDSKSDGIGLSNTKSRLSQLYKEKFLFSIRSDKYNKGTCINIEIPI